MAYAYCAHLPAGHIEEHFLRHLRDEDVAALYEAFCRVLGEDVMQNDQATEDNNR